MTPKPPVTPEAPQAAPTEISLDQLKSAVSSAEGVKALLTTDGGRALERPERIKRAQDALGIMKSANAKEFTQEQRKLVLDAVRAQLTELQDELQKHIDADEKELKETKSDDVSQRLIHLNTQMASVIEQREIAKKEAITSAGYIEGAKIKYQEGDRYEKVATVSKAVLVGMGALTAGALIFGKLMDQFGPTRWLKRQVNRVLDVPLFFGVSAKKIIKGLMLPVAAIAGGAWLLVSLLRGTREARDKQMKQAKDKHDEAKALHDASKTLATTTGIGAPGDAIVAGRSVLSGDGTPAWGDHMREAHKVGAETTIDGLKGIDAEGDLENLALSARAVTGLPPREKTALHRYLYDETGKPRDPSAPSATIKDESGRDVPLAQGLQKAAEHEIVRRIKDPAAGVVDFETVRVLAESRALNGRNRALLTLKDGSLTPEEKDQLALLVREENSRLALNRGEQSLVEDLLRTIERYNGVKKKVEEAKKKLIEEKARGASISPADQAQLGAAIGRFQTELERIKGKEAQLFAMLRSVTRSMHVRSLIEQTRLGYAMLEEDSIAAALTKSSGDAALKDKTVAELTALPGQDAVLKRIPAPLQKLKVSDVAGRYRTLEQQVGPGISREQVAAWVARLRGGIDALAAQQAGIAPEDARDNPLIASAKAAVESGKKAETDDLAYIASLETFSSELGGSARRQFEKGDDIKVTREKDGKIVEIYSSSGKVKLANGMLIDMQNIHGDVQFRRLFLSGSVEDVEILAKDYKNNVEDGIVTQNDHMKLATAQMYNFLIGTNFGPGTRLSDDARKNVRPLLPEEAEGRLKNPLSPELKLQMRDEWKRYGTGIKEYTAATKAVALKFTEQNNKTVGWATEMYDKLLKKIDEKVPVPGVSPERSAKLLGYLVLCTGPDPDFAGPKGVSQMCKLLGGEGLDPKLDKAGAGDIMKKIWPLAINHDSLGKFLVEYPGNVHSQQEMNRKFQLEFEAKGSEVVGKVGILEKLQSAAPPEQLALNDEAPELRPKEEVTDAAVTKDIADYQVLKKDLDPLEAETRELSKQKRALRPGDAQIPVIQGKIDTLTAKMKPLQDRIAKAERLLIGDYLVTMHSLTHELLPNLLKSTQDFQRKLADEIKVHAENFRILDSLERDWWKLILRSLLARAFLLNPAILAARWAQLLLTDPEFREAFSKEVAKAAVKLDDAAVALINKAGAQFGDPEFGNKLRLGGSAVLDAAANPGRTIKEGAQAAERTGVDVANRAGSAVGAGNVGDDLKNLKDKGIEVIQSIPVPEIRLPEVNLPEVELDPRKWKSPF
jgi:hypothetical protein